jgi:hypothetical protein
MAKKLRTRGKASTRGGPSSSGATGGRTVAGSRSTARRGAPPGNAKRAPLASALAKAVAGGATVISVASGQRVTISVDVDSNHLVPYGIAWDGEIILDSLVSKSATVTVKSGRHRLTWQFIHGFESEWHHTVSVAVDDGDPQEVASKNNANGDEPDTAGMVVINA